MARRSPSIAPLSAPNTTRSPPHAPPVSPKHLIAMPPPKTKSVALPRRRRPVKRSKTFSGCWTCRARGVKCDERKPRCARCDKARVACAGYGIRLVWEDDKERGLVPENGRSLRRVLLADPDAAPVLSNDELDVALAALDEGLAVRACGVDGVQRGPFTVFPTFPTTGRWRERFLPTAAAPCPQLAHCPGVPDEERRLMHHYVTYLSDLMLATRLGSSNPFQTVFIPLAMLEAGQQTPTPSHTALWHALCALAAYNLVRLDAREGQRHASVAIEHHALAFQSLRHCIGDRDPKIQHVVMATILLITIIEIMLNKPGWRVHLRGGRAWLRSLPDLRGVGRDSAVYQLFLLIETFASLQDQGSIGYRGSKTAKGRPDAEDADDSSQELTDLSDLDEYHLDSLYGIPKQLFQVVVEMNHVVRKDSPTRDELDRLELKILKNSPKARRGFPDTPHQQKLSHYAAAFYYASYIYFKCTLRNLPIADVQYLVRESARHIEAIDHLEDGKIPSLVWPGLITASAAGEEQTRQAMLRYFKRRENHRLRNLSTQVTLICEVWRRRDAGEAAKTVKEVMKEMGRDILLL